MSEVSASRPRAIVVSFSGLDGSGKTTQIESLILQLEMVGLRTCRLAFWDDVVVGSRYREGFVHRVFKSQKGIGAPGKPVERRDKNVRHWYLSGARFGLYMADAIHLRRVLDRASRSGVNVIVMDRYIYDELANLPLDSWFGRRFVRAIQRIVPVPDVAYLLDADPEAARRRKPEYPVDFMRVCRSNYFKLASMLGTMRLIPPLPLDEAKIEVVRAFMETDSAREMLLQASKQSSATSAA